MAWFSIFIIIQPGNEMGHFYSGRSHTGLQEVGIISAQ